ncbi:MAG: VanZ family protein [Polyangiaceae bacterium]|nr:VanZ family protein [Polyangiaceae bacterium]
MSGVFLHVLPAVAYAAGILVIGTASTDGLPNPQMNDKTLHFISFGVMVVLVLRAARFLAPRRPFGAQLLLASTVSMGVGVLLELLQALSPTRTPEAGDLLADLLGVVGAAAGAHLAVRWLGSRSAVDP